MTATCPLTHAVPWRAIDPVTGTEARAVAVRWHQARERIAVAMANKLGAPYEGPLELEWLDRETGQWVEVER